MATHVSEAALDRVEHSLALSLPFGDPDDIWERLYGRYAHRLSALATHLPQAAAARDALARADGPTRARVLADPLVRSAINRATAHFRLGIVSPALHELGDILDLAAECLRDAHTAPPLHHGMATPPRLGPQGHHGWIWMDHERQDNLSTRGFRALFRQQLASAGLALSSPSQAVRETLTVGAEFLDALVPALARSALCHVQLVAVVDHPPGFLSVTNPSIPGTICLSRTVLATPWSAAEYLLHEALHQKYVDMEHVLAFHGHGREETPYLIRPPWRRGKSSAPNAWTIKRSLTVLHVYTAMSLFFRVAAVRQADLEARYGRPTGVNLWLSVRRAQDRARYLARCIGEHADELGPAGVSFIAWLRELLDVLETERPDRGLAEQLALDLYERETEQIGQLLGGLARESAQTPPRLHRSLNRLLADDLASVSAMSGHTAVNMHWTPYFHHGDIASTGRSWEGSIRSWWATRALLSHTMRALPHVETVSIAGNTGTVSDHIANMVQSSSLLIEEVLAECSRHYADDDAAVRAARA